MLARILKFLFPASRWQGCHHPTNYERLSAWEKRMGEHRAAERLRAQRVDQLFDLRASVRPKVTPRLPADNVIPIRRKA